MSFMEKFQAQIERILVPLASKLNSQRHICSVRDAFILTFPLTMAGSLMEYFYHQMGLFVSC